MKLDLSEFENFGKFKFEIKSLGELQCRNFTVGALRQVRKWLLNNPDKNPELFTKFLLSILCYKSDVNEGEVSISETQLEKISKSELEIFSLNFIKNNRYILSYKSTFSENTEEGESINSQLLRMIELHISKTDETTQRILGNGLKGALSNDMLKLLQENRNISQNLENATLHHKISPQIEFPENPIFETNRKLESFGAELRGVLLLIKNINDLAIQSSLDSIHSAARSKFWNNVMFSLGLVTLLVGTFFSYLSYDSSKESDEQLAEILKLQNTLLRQQRADQEETHKVISLIPQIMNSNVIDNEKVKNEITEINRKLSKDYSKNSIH